jgi:hypothetical protein
MSPAIPSSPAACHSLQRGTNQFSTIQFAQDADCPPLCDKEYTECTKRAQEAGNIGPDFVHFLEQNCIAQRKTCRYCCTDFPQGRSCSSRLPE